MPNTRKKAAVAAAPVAPAKAQRTEARRLIDYYEEIAFASHRMLEAAYQGNWTAFELIGGQCQELIAGLQQASVRAVLTDADRERRMVLMREILADDARIRAHAEPRMRGLDRFLV